MPEPTVETPQLQSLVAPDSPGWWWVWTPHVYFEEGDWTPVRVQGEPGIPGTWHASFQNSMLTLSDIAKRMPESRWVRHGYPALDAPPVPPVTVKSKK